VGQKTIDGCVYLRCEKGRGAGLRVFEIIVFVFAADLQ